MDRRGRRGRRGRGRPRRDPGIDAESESSDSGSGHEVPARRGRRPHQAGLEEQIAAGIERGLRTFGRGRDGGGPAAQLGDVEDLFYQLYDRFSRLGPSRFSGGSIEAVEEWLASIKDKFRICRAPEHYQVELATHFLENAARFWWDNTKLNFVGEPEAITWNWFEEMFNDEFVGELRKEEMRQRFVNLKQEGRTVAEYNTEFVSLSRYAPDIRGDANRYRRHYINGLRPRIAGVVDNPATRDIKELMKFAAQLEEHHKREREEAQERNVRQKGSKGQSSNQGDGKVSGSNSVPVAKVEKNTYEWCRTCNLPHPESRCRRINKTCFRCGSADHWMRDCPKLSLGQSSEGHGNGGHPRGGGRMAGRDGSRGGGRGGGRIGVYAAELGYADPGSREKSELPHFTASTETPSGMTFGLDPSFFRLDYSGLQLAPDLI